MAEINNLGKEIVDSHTTEEVVSFLARNANGISSRIMSQEDTEKAIVLNYANVEMLFSIIKYLDNKLNGEKETVVL